MSPVSARLAQRPGPSLSPAPVRLLLVDDDATYRLIVTRLLRDCDWARFDVDLIGTSQEALQADPESYDVVLLDYQLGSSTGLDVLRSWGGRDVSTPVIMLTAMGGDATDFASSEAGACDYLDKADLDGRMLERAIRYAIRLSESMRATRESLRLQRRVAQAARTLLEVVERTKVAEQIVRATVDELGARGASLWDAQVDGSLRPGAIAGVIEFEAVDGIALQAIQRKSAVVSNGPRAGTSVALPLITPERIVGVLQVYGREAEFMAPPALEALATFSSLAALALRAARLHQEFHQAQKMESVGRLAGGIAHDFNNLLTAILGYAELLEGPNLSDDQRRSIEAVRTSGNRAAALTRQLLAFSRQQVLRPQVLDLNAVVNGIEDLLRRLIGEQVHFVTLSEVWPATARVDRGQIEQVLVNLVVNARDAMPDGGTLVVASRTRHLESPQPAVDGVIEPGSYVEVSVSDTGHGMDAETMQHVFEPFFTTKPLGKGTGLGLPTVLGIVQQSGGRMTLESALARGTTVTLLFPVAAADDVVQPAVAQVTRSAEPHATGRVLVVEDQQQVRYLIRRTLESAGYEVLEAEDGREALDRLEGPSGIDLVITDVVMPRLGGRAFVNAMRQRGRHTSVLLISGYPAEEHAATEPLPDGTAFLMKPFTSASLRAKVQECLAAQPGAGDQ